MIGGVGDEEDGGGDGGGGATGTQKRGSKQGEGLTSACFTLETERERWTRPGWKSRTGRRRTARGGEEQREQQNVKLERQDIRQVQFQSAATRRQQSARSPTHKAAGRGQTTATRRHHRPAQAASHSPRVLPINRLHPETEVLQHHWLKGYKMSVGAGTQSHDPERARDTCIDVTLLR